MFVFWNILYSKLNFCGSTIILLTFHHPWHTYSYGAYFMGFFATCPDKCNIQFYIANILIAANMKDRGTDFRFWWREIQSAQFAELWCLNMSINRFWPICIFLIECAVLGIWYPILYILFLGNLHRVCFKWDILQVWNEFKALAPEFLVYIGLLSD